MSEVKSNELRKLSACISKEMGDEDITIRVLKPFKSFYNLAMSIALKYGLRNLYSVNPDDYIDALKYYMKSQWRTELIVPGKKFFELCKNDVRESYEYIFNDIKGKIKKLWDTEIIKKSLSFKKMKIK